MSQQQHTDVLAAGLEVRKLEAQLAQAKAREQRAIYSASREAYSPSIQLSPSEATALVQVDYNAAFLQPGRPLPAFDNVALKGIGSAAKPDISRPRHLVGFTIWFISAPKPNEIMSDTW
jgi:hypothetical protein